MHFGNTRLEDILDIRGFNLNAILEIEPEGKSIQSPSLRGLPARRNPVLEAAPKRAQCINPAHGRQWYSASRSCRADTRYTAPEVR